MKQRTIHTGLMLTMCGLMCLAAFGFTSLDASHAAPAMPGSTLRFQAVDVFIETGDESLAAWQLTFHADVPGVKIVGIEGGEYAPFNEPPFYDPKAMMHDRVIIADYSTLPEAELPTGGFRIATIHVSIEGGVEPDYIAALSAAANANGDDISATLHISTRESQ